MRISSYTKSESGEYLAVSSEFVAFTRLNSISDILGRTDREMPWQACAAPIIEHDQEVIYSKSPQCFIESPVIAGKQYARRCFKSPVYDLKGEVMGVSGISYAIPPETLIPLSPQQTACLKSFAVGNTLKEIARELNLSPRTVEYYLNLIKDKLNCKTQQALVVQAMFRGLIGPYGDFTGIQDDAVFL